MQSNRPSFRPSTRPSSSPTRRRHPRTPVQVQVRWHNRREEGVEAEIHDISAEGLFVVSATPLPESIVAGDIVWVIVPGAANQNSESVLTGTIRWRGFHPTHQVAGCGIELDADSLVLVQQLFPAVSMRP